MRTVNSVLKTLTKVLKRLDEIVEQRGDAIAEREIAILRINDEIVDHTLERKRAKIVAERVSELIEQ